MAGLMKVLKKIKSLVFLIVVLAVSCKDEKSKNVDDTVIEHTLNSKNKFDIDSFTAIEPSEIDNNIRSIFQDKNGNYWFGTNVAGVYSYNGKKTIQFTVKDGLSNNQVQSIQEDEFGNMWFGTGVFGVSKFDGKVFKTFTNKENLQFENGSADDWKIAQNDMWFYAGDGVFRWTGTSLVYLSLSNFNSKQSQNSPFDLGRYAVYSLLKDSKKKSLVWYSSARSLQI